MVMEFVIVLIVIGLLEAVGRYIEVEEIGPGR